MDPFQNRVADTHPDPIAISLTAITYIMADDTLRDRFVALSGCNISRNMSESLEDNLFLAGILEFLLQHEPDLLEFCNATEITPEKVVIAHQKLSAPS